MTACAFCAIIEGSVPRPVLYEEHPEYVTFQPLNPVTAGHTLVVPRRHVPDAGYDWALTGRLFEYACATANHVIPGRMIEASYNLIVNKGVPAGQSVMHLHIHVVPRRTGDELAMPWSNPPLESLQQIVDDEHQWGDSDDW